MNTLYHDKASTLHAHSPSQLMSQPGNWPSTLTSNQNPRLRQNPAAPVKPPQLNTASVPRPPPDSLYSSGSGSGVTTDGRSTNATSSVRTTSTGQTSPPGSAGRASNAGPDLHSAGANTQRAILMEEALAKHYTFLRAYLARSYKDDHNTTRTNRAKDKLLRLSAIQFHELSTDVYDESQRREDEKYRGGQGIAGKAVPSYLPPKKNFHPKRNSARQKLATLPIDRFRQLATDVLYELERRFPRFLVGVGEGADRIASPTFSTVSSTAIPSRTRTPNGSIGGGGIAAMYASGVSQASSYSAYRADSASSGPTAVGSLGVPTIGDAGIGSNGISNGDKKNALKPLPKTSQSNVIVPKKSTLVEDDDDQSDGDEDAFGLEQAANASAAAAQANEDKARLEDYEFEIVKMKEKMNSLEDTVQDKDDRIDTLQQSQKQLQSASKSERAEQEKLRTDLERRLEEARDLNTSLQTELEKLRADKAKSERTLQQELEDLRIRNEHSHGSKVEVEEWKERYHDLQSEYTQQKEVTDSVRRDAAQFLQEMRELSERSDVALENEERLALQVARLEDEVKGWKGRYARAKAQLGSLRSSSTGLMAVKGVGAELDEVAEGGIIRPDGVVKDIHLTEFQASIDDFLRKSREQNNSSAGKGSSSSNGGAIAAAATLEGVKGVVQAVKEIVRDLDENGHLGNHTVNGTTNNHDDTASPQDKLRMGIGATANNLIAATHNHVSSRGLSPISLLDAAASHLTTAVIQLVRAVGVRRTVGSENGQDDDHSNRNDISNLGNKKVNEDARALGPGQIVQPLTNGYYKPDTNGLSDGNHSNIVDDFANSPANSPAGDSWTVRPDDRFPLPPTTMGKDRKTLDDLKHFLQDENALLVRNIQPLVHILRSTPSAVPLSSADESTISKHISEVGTSVRQICQRTMAAMSGADARDRDLALERHAGPIIANLEECRGELEFYGGGGGGNSISGGAREKIPPISFKLARVTKELITVVEGIENGEITAGGAGY